MIKTNKTIRFYIERLIKKANNKNDYKEACYYFYEVIINKYGWDKAQAIFEIIEKEYNVTLDY